MKKPSRASGYDLGHVRHVRSTCLYVATKLGDLIDDVVVIGGLVPSLLIDQQAMNSSDDLHVGTLDLDVGLALAVFNEQRYAALTARLRQAGFSPDQNDQGQLTRQRWKIDGDARVTIDFLIAPSLPGDKRARFEISRKISQQSSLRVSTWRSLIGRAFGSKDIPSSAKQRHATSGLPAQAHS